MKTILQVNGVMNRGGAEMMLMELIRRLHNDFRFVFMITCKKGTRPKGDFDDELRSYGILIYYIDAVWDVGVKEYERQFKAIVEQIGDVDVVHSHMNSKGGIISRCAKKLGIPKRIVHSHAKLVFDGSPVSRVANYAELYLQRFWINRCATDYWGCAEEALESLFTRTNRQSEKAQVIHNAIDLEKLSTCPQYTIRDELGLSTNDLVIGTVGRIATVKNYELAADVISELWKRGVDCHYVVAGRKQSDGSVRYLFDKLGNDSRFHYLDVRSDLPAIYHGFDIYLGTSHREGLGLTAVEAQSCGTYCVLSDGFPKLCDVGARLVSFVKGNDATAWADQITELSKALPRKTSEEICSAVRASGFDVATEAERVKELYANN